MKQKISVGIFVLFCILALVYLKSDSLSINYRYLVKSISILHNSSKKSFKTLLENNAKENLDTCFQLDSYLSKYTDAENTTMLSEEHQILKVINKNKINDLIIVTVSNFGFRDLTLNWILSLEKINIKKFVIFSFDKEFVDFLISKGYKYNVVSIPKNWIHLSVDKSPASFLSTNYYAITQAKTNVVYKLLDFNQKFIFSDVDCVWLNKAVLEYVNLIMKNSKAHMIYAQDFGNRQPYYNTGFFYGTATNFTKNLYFMMSKMQEQNKKSVDQFVFDGVLKKINFNDNRLATFDILTIANGKYYFHQRMDKIFNFVPFVVHANYFPSYETKINALKSRKHWFI